MKRSAPSKPSSGCTISTAPQTEAIDPSRWAKTWPKLIDWASGASVATAVFAAGPFEHATVNQALGVEVPADRQMMVGYGSVDRVADAVEQALLAHPYIAGDRFTAADVYVGAQLGWTSSVGMLPKRDVFDAYLGRVMGRPAAVRARQIDDTLIAEAAKA